MRSVPGRALAALIYAAATLLMVNGWVNGQEPISYSRQIKPIFQAQCLGCHQPAKAGGDFLMTQFESLLAGGSSGDTAIVPGKADESHLLELITPVDGVAEMPQTRPPLSETEIELIRRWIEQGAVNDHVQPSVQFSEQNPPLYSRQPVITSMDVSPDGNWMAVCGISEVALVNLQTKKTERRLIGRSPRIESIAFAPDGSRLLVTGGKPGEFGEVQVWEVGTGRLLQSISVTGDTLFGGSWSPDGRLVAFGGTDNTVRVIESESGKQVLFQNVAEDWVRDTVFSVDGSHLISVGRDMTCKLTEVATERFVDNITSITPGVLKGGISSISRHPQRDEIIVASSDGVPKLYRVFRETKRVIGDDANLLREFPAMLGRVQATAIAPSGTQMAFASGLDGTSQIRVYAYDFDTLVPDDIKAINSKVVTSRSADENQRLRQFLNSDRRELVSLEIPESAIFTLAYSPNGHALFAAGTDGLIRVIDTTTAQLQESFSVFAETTKADMVAREPLPPLGLVPVFAAGNEATSTPAGKLERLIVHPPAIELPSASAYTQLTIQAVDDQGLQYDVSANCQIQGAEELLTINANHVVEPKGSGTGALTITLGDLSATIPVACDVTTLNDVDFVRDVNPLLSRVGCNAGTCHGSQNGKRGFKLSLRGYDPIFDVRALTDELSARRVNVAAPEESLMLLKATGQVPHEGGALFQTTDRSYAIIREWIKNGAKLDLNNARVQKIELEPQLPVLADKDSIEQMRVTAIYGDGTRRDVTREAFVEIADQEIGSVNGAGQIMAKRRGEAAVLARYEGAFAATTLTVMGDRTGFVWADPPVYNEIDRLVAEKWERMKISPSDLCGDQEFLRRVYLDLTGLPPSTSAIRQFLNDPQPSPEKRKNLVDSLIGTPEFVDHWTNKWADLLQVNEKFLGPDGAVKFHAWIRQQIESNVPYDQFVRSIVAAQGSNAENPAAAYYKILRTPEDVMENTTHLFLATRFNCNKCHDHPFERWTQDQYYQTAAFFAQVAREPDPSGGDRRIGGSAVESSTPYYEIIRDLASGDVLHDRTKLVAPPTVPFPVPADLPTSASRREQFATWLTSPENPYFAASQANRIWGYLMGVGLIEPIDDIRASNPPTNPQLLQFLSRELVAHQFDTRHLIRIICQSRTYQLSVGTNRFNEDDRINYSHALPRRLPAEVLFDSLYFVTGSKTHFPGEPPGRRAAQLPDAGVKLPSGLLQTLGKPVRESACECERANDLHLGSVLAMVSGPDQANAIDDPTNEIAQLTQTTSDNRQLIDELYLKILNRNASDLETNLAIGLFAEIEADHLRLTAQLEQRRAAMAPVFEQSEADRLQRLASAQQELSEFIATRDPTLLERESARQNKINELSTALTEFEKTIDQQVLKSRADHLSTIQWHPLLATSVSQSNGSLIERLPDRSIFAKENKGNTTTVVEAMTDLPRISALRLEALSAAELPNRGPGLAPNGNFVVHELIVEMADRDTPEKWTPIKLKNPLADFSQASFPVDNLIDGNLTDTGWAVVPDVGKTHWATFEFETPLAPAPGTRLRISLAQNYQGDNLHQLGKLRISVSPAPGPVGLSVSEEKLDVLVRNPETWTAEERESLKQLLRIGSPDRIRLASQLAATQAPIAVDAEIMARREIVSRLSMALPRDGEWVRLEQDVLRSTQQLKELRRTAAQDLTWALLNSPAFLFNH